MAFSVAEVGVTESIMGDTLMLLERFAPADGAFYLYAAVGSLTQDSHDFCRRMLHDIGVACTPGIDFTVRSTSL